MKLNVVKNTKRNMLWGVILKLYQVIAPLLIRRVFIYQLGVEYAGLGGLFSSVLNFLNLAEMGVGSAVMFFLYKPIAENDYEEVRRLLGLIRSCYRLIGGIILVAGLALTPVIPHLISGEPPKDINVYIIYLMNIMSAVLSYWLFTYKNIILSALQRTDLLSRINIGTTTIKYIAQLAVLLCFRDYYLYLAMEIGTKLIGKLVTVLVVDKKYPMFKKTLKPTGQMYTQLRDKTSALILHKIGGVVVNSADAMVISAFLGLNILGKYQNYNQIMTSVISFVILINTSSQAGIGHKIISDDAKKNQVLFERYSFLFFAVSVVCCCCFLNLYQPFMVMWMGEALLLDNGIVAVICVYFYTFLFMIPGNAFENASGLWRVDRFRPLLEGLLNLGMNLALVKLIGLYGILLSTILSMLLFSIPWLYHVVIKKLLNGSYKKWLLTSIIQTASCVAICLVSYLVCNLIPPSVLPAIIDLAVRGIIGVIIPVALLFVLYHKNESLKWLCETILSMLGKSRKTQ